MWDQRYNTPDYVYGKTPNEFLARVVNKIPAGNVLCLGEGEGRNAVFLAEQGYEVTALDASSVGLAKAERLAAERGVKITTIHADLADYKLTPQYWNAIVAIYCHLLPDLRKQVLLQSVNGLKSGGCFILEAYTPRQLQYNTGGPRDIELLMELSVLKEELWGLHFNHAIEIEREVNEGAYHKGKAAVVQVLAVKP